VEGGDIPLRVMRRGRNHLLDKTSRHAVRCVLVAKRREGNMSNQNQERDCFGRVIQAPATFVRSGNSNPDEYAGESKNIQTPTCLNEDGSNKYASDGVTTDWFQIHPKE
jgi:hypothetical protein